MYWYNFTPLLRTQEKWLHYSKNNIISATVHSQFRFTIKIIDSDVTLTVQIGLLQKSWRPQFTILFLPPSIFSTNQLNTFSDRTKTMKQNCFRKYLFYYFENALRLIQGHLRTIIILTFGIKCHNKGPTIFNWPSVLD